MRRGTHVTISNKATNGRSQTFTICKLTRPYKRIQIDSILTDLATRKETSTPKLSRMQSALVTHRTWQPLICRLVMSLGRKARSRGSPGRGVRLRLEGLLTGQGAEIHPGEKHPCTQ